MRRQSFSAPIHLSKPHLDENVLIVNVVNPTAGLLSGDRVNIKVRVESGAKMLLTAPSASRAHRMSEGRAEVVQELIVEPGASLEILPELFIPQAGTRYLQRTSARVAEGGELLLFETIAPGRVASGESFAYDALEWFTDVSASGEACVRERIHLSPADESLTPLRTLFANAYVANCFIITPRLTPDSPCWPPIRSLHSSSVWVGTTRLHSTGWCIKLIAESSIALRATLQIIRAQIYASLARPVPSLRRNDHISPPPES